MLRKPSSTGVCVCRCASSFFAFSSSTQGCYDPSSGGGGKTVRSTATLWLLDLLATIVLTITVATVFRGSAIAAYSSASMARVRVPDKEQHTWCVAFCVCMCVWWVGGIGLVRIRLVYSLESRYRLAISNSLPHGPHSLALLLAELVMLGGRQAHDCICCSIGAYLRMIHAYNMCFSC